MIFSAFLLSLAIRPVADMLSRWRIPRGITVIVFYAGLGGTLALLGDLLVPVFKAELAHLQANGPALLQAALIQVATFPLAKQWLPSPSQLAQNLAQQLDILLNTLVSAVTGVRGLAVDLVLVSVLAYFFSTSTGWEEHLLSEWMPPRYQPRAQVVVAGRYPSLWCWQPCWKSYALLLCQRGMNPLPSRVQENSAFHTFIRS